MTRDLEPGDPGAFDDWPQGAIDGLLKLSHRNGYTKLCPICRGHGGWNLQLAATPLPRGCADTAANRHMLAHRRAKCDHCNGWGWVHPSDHCPRHEFVVARSLGRSLTLYQCAHCGIEREIDTSD
jgi:hypothetical protein